MPTTPDARLVQTEADNHLLQIVKELQAAVLALQTQISAGVKITAGAGSPEAAVIGSIGDLYLRTNGSTDTTLYVKEAGAATNTGWTAAKISA